MSGEEGSVKGGGSVEGEGRSVKRGGGDKGGRGGLGEGRVFGVVRVCVDV